MIYKMIVALAMAALGLDAESHPNNVWHQLAVAGVVTFSGSCDASAAVVLNDKLFAVADDEDNVIRVYDAYRGGPPIVQYDLSYHALLQSIPGSSGRPDALPLDEMDIEAATELDGSFYWISSHGRDRKGRQAPDRLRFFAAQIDLKKKKLLLTAPVMTNFLAKLLEQPALKPFNLEQAAQKPPKAFGGFNLEGMTAMSAGRLLFGFRNPIPADRALLLILNNPRELLTGAEPKFAPPILLDLEGRGVRGLSFWQGQFLIAAGHFDGKIDPGLYTWQGPDSLPVPVDLALPEGFNIEAFYTPDNRQEFMLLSDDGSLPVDGTSCKRLKQADKKYFRGVWVKPNNAKVPLGKEG